MRIKSAAFLAPSLSMMRARWISIVRGEMPSARPASLLDAPATICSRTSRSRARRRRLRLLAHRRGDRLAHALYHFAAAERLLDEIEGAVLDRLDRHRDVAGAGDD